MAGLLKRLAGQRELIGKLMFEVVIIFIGVTAAFALESARQDRADTKYRQSMIAALIPTLDDVLRHNKLFTTQVDADLAAFDAALRDGRRPLLPIYREPGSERPPTRAWDGIVATGVSRALPPDLFFELSLFYTRQESVGERYVRYAEMTERDIFPLGPKQDGIYEPDGALKPQYAAYVDRLRDLSAVEKLVGKHATSLKARLQAVD